MKFYFIVIMITILVAELMISLCQLRFINHSSISIILEPKLVFLSYICQFLTPIMYKHLINFLPT